MQRPGLPEAREDMERIQQMDLSLNIPFQGWARRLTNRPDKRALLLPKVSTYRQKKPETQADQTAMSLAEVKRLRRRQRNLAHGKAA